MKRYALDPYWMTARYPGTCRQCGRTIKRGERAFYYPNGKHLFCATGRDCGQVASADFDAAANDEAFMNRETV
jgi:hypothetical protein